MKSGIVTQWPSRQKFAPFVTVGLALACIFVFLACASVSPILQQALIDLGGMQAVEVSRLLHQPPSAWWSLPLLSVFTALFLHDSWLHLAGNLVYFWVFGVKIEQRLGHFAAALVFLLGGALANVFVALKLFELATPIIGASGAVSAVVGAYLALFPSRRIGLYLPLGLYLQFARVPALIVIGSWFALQLLYTIFDPTNAAVAWWTHLAGFGFGIGFILTARALSLLK